MQQHKASPKPSLRVLAHALEINDPWLADIVRRAGAGENIIDSLDFSLEPQLAKMIQTLKESRRHTTIFRVDDVSLQ